MKKDQDDELMHMNMYQLAIYSLLKQVKEPILEIEVFGDGSTDETLVVHIGTRMVERDGKHYILFKLMDKGEKH